MMKRLIWMLFQVALLGSPCVFGFDEKEEKNCSLIISELQLGGNFSLKVTQEFIELELDGCAPPFDLSRYTLVLWRSNADPSKMDLRSRARFSGSACASMKKSFLVIGNPTASFHPDSQFCSLAEFGKDWPGGQHGFIDKGNGKTNALVLYRDVPEDQLQVGVTMLNAETARRENIVDLIFFAKNGGKGEAIRELLFPEYTVSTSDHSAASIYFRLKEKDAGSVTADQKHSFSFCCEQTRVAGKWPMGFKYSKPTPGSANNCSELYEYCLDAVHSTYNATLDRCDVQLITNYFNKEDNPVTGEISSSIVTESSTADAETASSGVLGNSGRSLGIGLGIGLSVASVSILVLVVITYHKQKRAANPSLLGST